jgi:hypothetical protein
MPFGLYVGLLIVGIFVTRPPLITDDFSGTTARRFSIAIVTEVDGDNQYERRTLETLQESGREIPSFSFLLPEDRNIIVAGDIHHVTVLEDHGDWQLIKFNYSNTYTATSIYRAYVDRVEPVSYQMNSSFADVVVVFAMIVPAYLLALVITFVRNRKARTSA